MTDKKLTPRVGDRVLISPSNTVRDGKRTHVGTIRQTGELPDQWQVAVDGQHRYWLVGEQHLTVVDREPVEWPDVPSWAYGDLGWDGNSRHEANVWEAKASIAGLSVSVEASALSADEARLISKAWAQVAEHWDELVGGE